MFKEISTTRYCWVRRFGPLAHQRIDTQPLQKWGEIHETWRLPPFELFRSYVRDDPKYGDWMFSINLRWRRWRGPWLTVSLGTGAHNWDEDEQWWKPSEEET